VFVFGANGFIGNAVAKRFVRAGYKVYGLTRSEEKANALRKDEIHPVVGKAQDASGWEKIVRSVDIVVEALADYQDPSSVATIQKILVDVAKDPRKVVIYTSGIWLFGNTTHYVDETSPYDHPAEAVTWRVGVVKSYRDAGAIVLCPGCVYGYTGSLTASWFKSLSEGKGEFPGYPNNEPYWGCVHLDDLADAYVMAAQKGSQLRGETITLFSQVERVKDALEAVAKVVGYKGEIKFAEPQDLFGKCLALSQRHISNAKAKLVLGWNPKKTSITADAETYYNAWKAAQ